jgi:inosose dehydratase
MYPISPARRLRPPLTGRGVPHMTGSMKIGLSTYSLSGAITSGQMSVIDAIRWIADNGGDHVEMSPSGYSLVDNDGLVRDVVRAARGAGIDISSYTIGADLTPRAERELRNEIDRLKRNVDIGAALGVKRMRHDVISRAIPETTLEQFERDLPTAVDACREVADYAAKSGITTSLENHGFHFQGSDRVLRLVTAVNRPNYRVTLDIGNFLCADENPLDAVRRLVPYASMVHFKDFYVRRLDRAPGEGWFQTRNGNHLRGAIVGHGDIDVPAVLDLVIASGYDGYASVEFEGMEECRLGSRLGMATLRRLLEERKS